jgi:hypothetical protein
VLRLGFPATGAAVAIALAGCGSSGYGHDVKGFTEQATAQDDQGALRSIATYRTTSDEKLACSLVTSHFLKLRFDGKTEVCEAISRQQTKHELPKSAKVESIAGAVATVRVAEPTATRSLYKMKQENGIWKIDDIVEAR